MGLAMLGDKLSAEQAAAWGLIWQCVDDADFAASVDTLVERLATSATRGSPKPSGRCTQARIRSKRSSTWNATSSGCWGEATTIAKA